MTRLLVLVFRIEAFSTLISGLLTTAFGGGMAAMFTDAPVTAQTGNAARWFGTMMIALGYAQLVAFFGTDLAVRRLLVRMTAIGDVGIIVTMAIFAGAMPWTVPTWIVELSTIFLLGCRVLAWRRFDSN